MQKSTKNLNCHASGMLMQGCAVPVHATARLTFRIRQHSWCPSS